MKTIGAWEVTRETHALLQRCKGGETVKITWHGDPIALIGPIDGGRDVALRKIVRMLEDVRPRPRGIESATEHAVLSAAIAWIRKKYPAAFAKEGE